MNAPGVVSSRRGLESVHVRAAAHALDSGDACDLRQEGGRGVLATDPMAVSDDQVEPLLVMDDVALPEVPPDDLCGDLTEALAAQFIV